MLDLTNEIRCQFCGLILAYRDKNNNIKTIFINAYCSKKELSKGTDLIALKCKYCGCSLEVLG